MVKSGSNTDSDEEGDAVSDLLVGLQIITEGVKEILSDDNPTRMTTRSNKLMEDVEYIAQTSGIMIDKAKKPKSNTTVVRSSYSLRSGLKGMDVDLAARKGKGKEKKTNETDSEKARKGIKLQTLNAARKRKGKETETSDVSGLGDDPEEACKRIRKGRNKDEDDADKDGAAGGYATRSTTRNMLLKSN